MSASSAPPQEEAPAPAQTPAAPAQAAAPAPEKRRGADTRALTQVLFGQLKELKPGTRVVSHAFDMGDWKPEETASVSATYGPGTRPSGDRTGGGS